MANITEQIDETLASYGCRYDAENEQFVKEGRPIELAELTEYLPDLTLDELTSYQEAKYDELTSKRAA